MAVPFRRGRYRHRVLYHRQAYHGSFPTEETPVRPRCSGDVGWHGFDRLEEATRQHNPELAALFTLLAYTGLRLSEGLGLKWANVDLGRATALCGRTKNGDPRLVHLLPRVVAALGYKMDSTKCKLFRWSRSGALYLLVRDAYEYAGIDHGGAPFHVLRHTYGAWATRIGVDLVGTGIWKSHTAARVYQHFVVSEEAAKADLLPGARRTK